MRFGLIGYGAWGQHHAEAIKRAPGAELVAIACNTEETAAKARRDHPDVSVYSDYRRLLADPSIDAVDIVVPNYLHDEVGVAALQAGKHVLLEKPMAVSPEACDRLIKAQRQAGMVLSIAHDYRTSTQYLRIKELLDAGALGEPRYISINLFRNKFRNGAANWRFSPTSVGSWILEEPVHFVDLVLWYMEPIGDPLSVLALGNSVGREPGLHDNFTCLIRFSSDAYACITQTLGGFQHHTQVQVVGSLGAARTYWSGTMDRTENPSIGFQVRTKDLKFERGVTECETLDFRPDSEGGKLQSQIDRIVKAFAEGRAPTPGEEARKRVVVCVAAERSIREGREIPLQF